MNRILSSRNDPSILNDRNLRVIGNNKTCKRTGKTNNRSNSSKGDSQKKPLSPKQADLLEAINWDDFWKKDVAVPSLPKPREGETVPRWSNAFLLMKSDVTETAKKIASVHKQYDGVDISVVSARAWGKADPQQKQKYIDAFQKLREKYMNTYPGIPYHKPKKDKWNNYTPSSHSSPPISSSQPSSYLPDSSSYTTSDIPSENFYVNEGIGLIPPPINNNISNDELDTINESEVSVICDDKKYKDNQYMTDYDYYNGTPNFTVGWNDNHLYKQISESEGFVSGFSSLSNGIDAWYPATLSSSLTLTPFPVSNSTTPTLKKCDETNCYCGSCLFAGLL